MPARRVYLVTLSLSEAGPGRFGGQVCVTDIYHTMPYHACACACGVCTCTCTGGYARTCACTCMRLCFVHMCLCLCLCALRACVLHVPASVPVHVSVLQ